MKQLLSILQKPRLVALGDLQGVAGGGEVAEKAIYEAIVPAEVLAAEAVLIDRPDDPSQKLTKAGGQRLQFFVVGRLKQIVVEVAHQVMRHFCCGHGSES